MVRSPTLTEIVNTTDVYSDNFFAEMLIKLLGARFGGAGTTAAGAAVVEAFARAHGSGVHAVDGSGLTRSNRASPRQVVDLLLAMRDDPAGDEFIQDLALAGQEGTVDDRMHGTAAYGRCRTKTGTITGVSNLSGYCFNTSGRMMVFSILMNGVGDLGLAHLEQDRIAGRRRRLLSEQRQQARFVEDLGPELLRLGQLRAGALAGDDVVGFLRDRVGDLAAGRLDQRRRLLAGQLRQGAGEDDGLAFQRAARWRAVRRRPPPAAGPSPAASRPAPRSRSSASDSAICTAMIGPTPSTSSICSGSASCRASIEPKWSASASAVT